MQRLLDIVLSSLALLVLSPLLLPIGIALLLTGEHEVFYFQERVGKGGVTFKLFKFATMLKNSPNMGTGTITVKNDPRILPMGKFLRKTKINELPQLLNILIGDMSVVGPRPQTRRCFDVFPESSKRAIMAVRPGRSGVGSIVFRDEEELMHAHADPAAFYDQAIAPYKGSLEEWYVANQSIRTYLSVIALTAWVVAFPSSDAVWKTFPSLPPEPDSLRRQRASLRH
jgi:lipopolysaccharide/colanic/teichoic acid biosynthesis glycosyltransferase